MGVVKKGRMKAKRKGGRIIANDIISVYLSYKMLT